MKTIGLLDSQVIRAALVALVGVIGLILSFFGVSEAVFSEKATRLIDALLLLLTACSVLYGAWARATKPTPPITDLAALKTADRVRQGGFARPAMLSVLAVAALGLLTLAGCTGTRDAYRAAAKHPQALEASAFVVAEHYYAVRAEAAALRTSGKLTGEALARVQAADLVVAPLVLGDPATRAPGLVSLVATYKAVRSASSAADLQAAIDAAVVKLADLVNALKPYRS